MLESSLLQPFPLPATVPIPQPPPAQVSYYPSSDWYISCLLGCSIGGVTDTPIEAADQFTTMSGGELPYYPYDSKCYIHSSGSKKGDMDLMEMIFSSSRSSHGSNSNNAEEKKL
ncbi:unnamed protein product [Cuscuta europaea]|uniref:Uncharacterized protein n=1 Tax=Cuscuta europaea TaxID=41803 RepID=A0A9P1E278_CUSEU|nr:unnamed protein product [Cuscuta europaea]